MRDRQLRTLQWAVLALGVASGFVATSSLTPAEASGGGRLYIVLKNVAYWGSWSALIPGAVRVALLIRTQRWSWPAALGAHAAAGAICASLHLAVLSSVDLLGRVWLLGRPLSWRAVMADLSATPRLIIEWELTMYAALAAFAYATALADEVRDRAVSEAQLETSLAEARLSALQRQLQPHFLFNTLHGVSSLIRRDANAAEEMVERLGRLLRTALRASATFEVSLADDVAALEDYLAIEAVQMGERLSVGFDIDLEARRGAVPALLLQPLVENCVRHGLQPRARGGRIEISARRVGSELRLEIGDDGVGLQPGRPEGVGLVNTRGRLEQLYGVRQSLTMAARDGGGVLVRVTLPFRVKEPE